MGEDFFFPLSTAGCMEMCPHRCGRFLSGRFPICGAESEIDAVSVLNLSGRICIGATPPRVRAFKISVRAKGEVLRGEGGVTGVVLHPAFYLFAIIRMEPIHFLSTSTIPSHTHW